MDDQGQASAAKMPQAVCVVVNRAEALLMRGKPQPAHDTCIPSPTEFHITIFVGGADRRSGGGLNVEH